MVKGAGERGESKRISDATKLQDSNFGDPKGSEGCEARMPSASWRASGVRKTPKEIVRPERSGHDDRVIQATTRGWNGFGIEGIYTW